MDHVLVVRSGALGDAVLTLPVFSALLQRAKRVTVLGAPASWGFLNPGFDRLRIADYGAPAWLGLFGCEAGFGREAGALLAEIDCALVYQTSGRDLANRALRDAGVAKVLGAAPPRLEGPPPGPPVHAATRLLAPLAEASLGPSTPKRPVPIERDPLLRVSEAERAAALFRLGLEGVPRNGLITIHPGSGGKAKCWPASRFASLAEAAPVRWGLTPVFLFGPADAAARAALETALTGERAVPALVDRPVREVLALLSLSAAYVGNDSGVTHLAARAAPTLALFGPSDPRIWSPLGHEVRIIRAPEGRMEALTSETVIAALDELLAGSRARPVGSRAGGAR
jgi:ADP-heptose:LPS heptosyltransferase